MDNTISEKLIDDIIDAICGIIDTAKLVNPNKKGNVKKKDDKKVGNSFDEDETQTVEKEEEDVVDEVSKEEKRIGRIEEISNKMYEHAKKLLHCLYHNFNVLYPNPIDIHETTFFKNYIPNNHAENDYLNNLINYVPRYFKENQNLLKSREDRQQFVITFLLKITKRSPAIKIKPVPNPVIIPTDNEDPTKTENPFYNEVLTRLDEPFQTIMRSEKENKTTEDTIKALKLKGFDYPEQLIIKYRKTADNLVIRHGRLLKRKKITDLIKRFHCDDEQIRERFKNYYGEDVDVETIAKIRKSIIKP